jgi:hypothetical protein
MSGEYPGLIELLTFSTDEDGRGLRIQILILILINLTAERTKKLNYGTGLREAGHNRWIAGTSAARLRHTLPLPEFKDFPRGFAE